MPAARLTAAVTAAASACLALVAVAPPAAAAVPVTVTTIAGDPRVEGVATAISVPPFGVLPYGDDLLVAAGAVVRRIHLDTGLTTVFAGVGSGAYSRAIGDGGPARDAVLEGAGNLAAGPDGSVYIVERTGNRIRRVTPDGVIRTVAGSRSGGFAGDGGPATAAEFYGPRGIAVAADGTVYVADSYNDRVRAIGPDGVIRTIAGTGSAAFSGDGGPATEAALNQPAGLALDADGSLLVADSHNSRIRRIRDGVITTVAGVGTAGDPGDGQFGDGTGPNGDGGPAVEAVLHEPAGVSVDGDGYLVADTLNHKIRRVDGDGVISTVAGGGTRQYGADGVPAVDSNLFAPEGAVRMPDGRMAIADTRGQRVRLVDTGGTISTVAGNYYHSYSGDGGPATRAQIANPHYVAVAPDGDVWFMSHRTGAGVIRRVDAGTGRISTEYGLAPDNAAPPDEGPALTAYLVGVGSLSFDRTGVLYFVDGEVVRRMDPATGRQQRWAGHVDVHRDAGDGGHRLDATFVFPAGLFAAPDGSVYVTDIGSHRVRRIGADGTVRPVAGTGTRGFSGDGGPATSAQLDAPVGVGMDAAGVLYVAEDSGRVRAIGRDGTIRTVVGVGNPGTYDNHIPGPASQAVVRPTGMAVLPDGSLVLSDLFANAVRHYDPRTKYVTNLAGDGLAGWRDGDGAAARFAFPGQVAWDPVRDRIVVGDGDNGRIRAIALTTGRLAPAVATPSVTTYGGHVTITGTVSRLDGTPKPGVRVVLQSQPVGRTAWTAVATVTSGSDGRVAVTRLPAANVRYRWVYDAHPGPVASAAATVTVRAVVSAAWSASRIRLGGTAYLSGSVRPAHPGERLHVQRYAGGTWRTIGYVTLSSASTYRFAYRALDRSDPVLRAYRPADASHPVAFSLGRTLVVD